jgi:hypothetical protein
MLRWSQISTKQAFDEVFVKYARSQKPGLILGQWNHLGDFNQINGDERCMLPAELWGKDEDYLWYSTGGAACFTDLAAGVYGEGTLQARYIRGAFDDKPFTLGKYESTRTRVAIAELAANGGAPMGFYTRFSDPAARAEIVRYYQFLKRHDAAYHANAPHAEAVLIYPRSQVHQGNIEPVETFRQLGKQLLEAHVLFDVLPDDLAGDARLANNTLLMGPPADAALPEATDPRLSRFTAPFTVRVSASRPAKGDELTVHFVNYNRTEPEGQTSETPSAGSGIVDEKPLAVSGVTADVVLPAGFRAGSVDFVTPEQSAAIRLEAAQSGGRLKFSLPEFLVYGVARIQLERAE